MSGWGPELSNWVPDVDLSGALSSVGNAMPDISAVTTPLDEYKAWILGVGSVLGLGVAAYRNRSSVPNFFSRTGAPTPAPTATSDTPQAKCPFSTSSNPLTTELSVHTDAEAEAVLEQGAASSNKDGNAANTDKTSKKPEPTRDNADEPFETIGDRIRSGRLSRSCRRT